MRKESSYQKLKRELKESKESYAKLKTDFKKYTKGDLMTKTLYDVTFKIEDQLEQTIWNGSTNAT